MKTIQIDQKATDHTIARPTGVEGLTRDVFAMLSSMCGKNRDTLPCPDEIESLLANLDLFTQAEYEYMIKFIIRFLDRIAGVIVESIRYYLNELQATDTITRFFNSMKHELDLARSGYYESNLFESLFAIYLLKIDGEEEIF
jgi:hypothetical protein